MPKEAKTVNKAGIAVVMLVVVVFFSNPAVAAEQWRKFKADEYIVNYPAGFTVRHTPDGTYFTSRDKTVEFYVYSAWMGKLAEDYPYKVQPRETTIKLSHDWARGREYAFIRANDGTYLRQYVDVRDGRCFRVFGIKYKSEAAYKKYKPLYDKFIRSFKSCGGDDP